MELFVVDLEPYLEFYEFKKSIPKSSVQAVTLIALISLHNQQQTTTRTRDCHERRTVVAHERRTSHGEKNQSCQSCYERRTVDCHAREEPEIVERRTRDCHAERRTKQIAERDRIDELKRSMSGKSSRRRSPSFGQK
ncbi:hypothetical protein Syun_031592 [Stephania yunnanensis]|uniref:Uncharacterized protein n=1 Tax=Stephania yunnanensis TaxID=152371 RepID=A0AAP0DW67_9MAGN